jgi:hypothetical protein
MISQQVAVRPVTEAADRRRLAAIPGSQLGRGLVIRGLPDWMCRQRAPRGDQAPARRAAVMAVTAQALAGRGGMPGLLWSHVWLTDALTATEKCPDEASFEDTLSLTEIGSECSSHRARVKQRSQRAFVDGNQAA